MGADEEVAVKRVARLADGWFSHLAPNEEGRAALERFRGYVREAGRDPARVGVEGRVPATGPLDEWVRRAEAFRDMGMTHLELRTAGSQLPDLDAHAAAMRVLLAIPLALIGPDHDGLTAGAVLWVALSALTPYFMWRYLRLLLPPAAAALGAAFCALWPLHIAYAGFFTSETPGLAFLVLSLWLAERSVRLLSTGDGLFAGLAGGFAAAIRPAFALNVILAALPLVR